jgi:hypothetical protein
LVPPKAERRGIINFASAFASVRRALVGVKEEFAPKGSARFEPREGVKQADERRDSSAQKIEPWLKSSGFWRRWRPVEKIEVDRDI